MIDETTPSNTQSVQTNPRNRINQDLPDPVEQDRQEFTEADNKKGLFFRQFLPSEFSGQHPSSIMDRMRTNPDVVNQVATGMFEQQIGNLDDPDSFFQENDTSREEQIGKISRNIQNSVTETVYSGEEVAISIGKGLKNIREDTGNVLINSARREVEKNPKEFSSLVNENGRLNLSNTAFNDLINNDDELFQEVLKKRLDTFDEQLTKKHNAGVIDPAMRERFPKQYAEAFAIFERFGKEGLSDYINFFQRVEPNKPFDEQDSFAQDAINFLNTPTQDGQTPLEFAKKVVDNTEFKPLVPKKPKPANYNNLTAKWLDTDENQDKFTVDDNEVVGLLNLMDDVDFNIDDSNDEGSVLSRVFGSEIEDIRKKEVFQLQNPDSDEVLPEDVVDLLATGDTNAFRESGIYNNFINTFAGQLQKGEGDVKLADVFATIQTYSVEKFGAENNDNGDPVFRVDYESAPMMVKVAMDALTNRSAFDMFVSKDGDEFLLDPNKIERLEDRGTREIFNLTDVKQVERVLDDEGNVVREKTIKDAVGTIPEGEPLVQREGNIERAYILDNNIGLTDFGGVWNTGIIAFKFTFRC